MKSDPTLTTVGLPCSDFAMLAARIGQVAAAWAADTLALPEDLSQPMDAGSVERFAEDILRRVYRIRERAYDKVGGQGSPVVITRFLDRTLRPAPNTERVQR